MRRKSFRKWFSANGAAAFFDRKFYLATNIDVARATVDPFEHYLGTGWREGRDPSAEFSTLYYKDKYLVPQALEVNPLVHYAALSPVERNARQPHSQADVIDVQKSVVAPFFDEDFYVRTYNLKLIPDPLRHYLVTGWRKGYEPNEDFATADYIERNSHISYGDICPFYHYASTWRLLGLKEPTTHDARQEIAQENRPRIILSAEASEVAEIIGPHFDATYYLRTNPDVRQAGVDPLRHYVKDGWREGRNPSELFWNDYYRRTNSDALPSDTNPFYHYLAVGRASGLRPNPVGFELWPTVVAPTDDEWGEARSATDLAAAAVVVIIPVYKGYDDTLRAIHAVLANRQTTSFALLVVNDHGPLPELNEELQRLAEEELFIYLENRKNLGFVATVNRALTYCAGKDVILLNSDAVPYGDWIDRMLWHAEANPDAATITPFSNNATICSYPQFNHNNRIKVETSLGNLDAYARECNAGQSSDLPTGVGFCFYMRRSVIDVLGDLDAETFGRGYGEESDFCLRARKAGYRNLLAHDIFVYHSGGSSFDSTFADHMESIETRLLKKHPDYTSRVLRYIEADPARDARIRLDLKRLARNAGPNAAVIVTHDRGGGIGTHVTALTDRLIAEGVDVFAIKIVERSAIRIAFLPKGRSIATFALDKIDLGKQGHLLACFLEWLQPRFTHVHSLVGLDWGAAQRLMACIAEAGRYYFTLHDYSPLCHRNDLVTPIGHFCGLAPVEDCRRCIASDHESRAVPDPAERRAAYGAFLRGAEAVFAPSEDIAGRVRPFVPGTRIVVRPHEEVLRPIPWRNRRALGGADAQRVLRIAAIGAIGPHKGSGILHDLAVDARIRDLPIQYRIIGYSNMPDRTRTVGITESGHYNSAKEALELLRSWRIDLVLIPSIWPETYCYTLSLALAAGVPPVVLDLGAPAERLRATGEGLIVDPSLMDDPSAFNDLLLETPLSDLYDRRKLYERREYEDVLRSYYGLPPEPAARDDAPRSVATVGG